MAAGTAVGIVAVDTAVVDVAVVVAVVAVAVHVRLVCSVKFLSSYSGTVSSTVRIGFSRAACMVHVEGNLFSRK